MLKLLKKIDLRDAIRIKNELNRQKNVNLKVIFIIFLKFLFPTTISKDANKYFVSILVEVTFTKPIINPTSVVGLDLGIKDFISNGKKLKNEVKVNEKRLKGF